MQQFEIEIKSLIGSKDAEESLLEKMRQLDPELVTLGHQKQLNHYFEKGNLANLYKNIESHLQDEELRARFKEVIGQAKSFSLRTRDANGKVLLIIKIAIDDTTSDNGTARMEFEAKTPDLNIEDLDNLVLKSGFEYQAKWSRQKVDYRYKGVDVAVSFSPGYGYVAEFEKIITDPAQADATKTELRKVMKELGVEELAQDRLERMFTFYNNHWAEYYGTDKVFEIK